MRFIRSPTKCAKIFAFSCLGMSNTSSYFLLYFSQLEEHYNLPDIKAVLCKLNHILVMFYSKISVTFIVLQVLGSMSILPGNQSSISSNLPGDQNDRSKDQNIHDPVNIRHLNKDKAENILMEGKYILIHLYTCVSNGMLFLFCS